MESSASRGRMTDQEMNEAVARKLGWQQCQRGEAIGWHRKLTPEGNHFHERLPGYINEIESAWEIVDWFNTQFAYVELEHFSYEEVDHPVTGWRLKLSEGWNNKTQHENRLEAEAESAPKAICEAFLKLGK